ncbi:YraN family protein [Actinotignum timonense]|nr:YraN family protein [Actinotignum timonense]MBS5748337.1 YraN family protein [Actinotignum schaalii]MDK6906521.1 YraN family protein [Actinotignum timonense]
MYQCETLHASIARSELAPLPASATTRELGEWGESVAAAYVREHGYQVLAQNWRCRRGEIDLICREEPSGALVAVEVKTRRGHNMVPAPLAVSPEKYRRLRCLLARWLHADGGHYPDLAVDIVAVTVPICGPVTIDHLRNAS